MEEVFNLETEDMTKFLGFRGKHIGERECFIVGVGNRDEFYAIKALVRPILNSNNKCEVKYLGTLFGDTHSFIEDKPCPLSSYPPRNRLHLWMESHTNGFKYFNNIEEVLIHLKNYYNKKKNDLITTIDKALSQLDSPILINNRFPVF